MISKIMRERAKRRPPGRPRRYPEGTMTPGRFVRLGKTLDAAVEIRRREIEERAGVPVEFSEAMRQLIEEALRARGLMK